MQLWTVCHHGAGKGQMAAISCIVAAGLGSKSNHQTCHALCQAAWQAYLRGHREHWVPPCTVSSASLLVSRITPALQASRTAAVWPERWQRSLGYIVNIAKHNAVQAARSTRGHFRPGSSCLAPNQFQSCPCYLSPPSTPPCCMQHAARSGHLQPQSLNAHNGLYMMAFSCTDSLSFVGMPMQAVRNMWRPSSA